mgnify:CR=1 FL=1
MSIGIFIQHLFTKPEVCGSVGPRIDDSTPRCGHLFGHEDAHRGYSGSGFENVCWGDPEMRDLEFVKEYTGKIGFG